MHIEPARHHHAPCVFPKLGILATLVAIALFPSTARAINVRLKNDLTPGIVTAYAVRIEGTRTTPTPHFVEKTRFEQRGTLTLVVLDAPDPRHARRVWMMTLDMPRVLELTRNDEPVADPPSAKALGLPPQASQLRLATIDAGTADASPVGGSRVQRAGLLLALDFAQWPNRLLAEGEHWETQSRRTELAGVWKHVYAGMTGRGKQRLARGSFEFSGSLAGAFAGVAEVERARGTWNWRVATRGLASSESEVALAYGPAGSRRKLRLNVALELQERRKLDPDALAQARGQLRRLSDLAATVGAAKEDEAGLAAFVEENPHSLWLPVAHDLLERVRINTASLGPMDRDELRDTLTALVRRWQRAALGGSVESLQPVRATFRELMAAQRAALHGLAGDTDQNMRAMAAFCVAFGDKADDLAVVTAACADASARVRMWAAYGLAERRDPGTDVNVLMRLLGDEDPKVRIRACMATRGCLQAASQRRAEFVRRLLRMVNQDPIDEVHPHAAQTLSGLATAKDLPALIAAEARQEVPAARWQLEATIRRLGGIPQSEKDD